MDSDKDKGYTPTRMAGEIKVYCDMCNGYLWSTSEGESGHETDHSIPCPKWKNNECGYTSGMR